MNTKLSKGLMERFADFLENHPPQQFSIFLRKMLLEYIKQQSKIGFHIDFSRLLWSLDDLFDLMDKALSEISEHEKSQHSAGKRLEKKIKKARKPKISTKRSN